MPDCYYIINTSANRQVVSGRLAATGLASARSARLKSDLKIRAYHFRFPLVPVLVVFIRFDTAKEATNQFKELRKKMLTVGTIWRAGVITDFFEP